MWKYRVMRKVLAGTLLVVALAFVLAGCGGSASSTTNTNGTTAPRHASNGEASKSARQVLADAVKSTAKATFMRINGNVTSSGKKFGLNFLISQNGDGSKGILYPSGQAVGQMGEHVPVALHVDPLGQVPHEPPQPSGPHCLPEQLGAQHCLPVHTSPAAQVPQEPPQPSSPHMDSAHCGLQ